MMFLIPRAGISEHACPNCEESHLRSTDLCMACALPSTITLACRTEKFSLPSFELLNAFVQNYFHSPLPRLPTLNHFVEVHILPITQQSGSQGRLSEFLARLRAKVEHCDFGPVLGERLRDHLFCGTRSLIPQRLFARILLSLSPWEWKRVTGRTWKGPLTSGGTLQFRAEPGHKIPPIGLKPKSLNV